MDSRPSSGVWSRGWSLACSRFQILTPALAGSRVGQMTLLGTILVLHILTALCTGAVLLWGLKLWYEGQQNNYQTAINLIASLTLVTSLFGAVLVWLSPTATAWGFCQNLGLYLTVIVVVEGLLYQASLKSSEKISLKVPQWLSLGLFLAVGMLFWFNL